MGEDVYHACWHWIQWSDDDDEFSCLCTEFFSGDEIDIETVKAFALLGAAVRLAWLASHAGGSGYLFIPDDIPLYVIDAIRSLKMGD